MQALLDTALANAGQRVAAAAPVRRYGRVTEVVGSAVHATVTGVHVGELCELRPPGGKVLHAEVIGFGRNGTILSPLTDISGLSPETQVLPLGRTHDVSVGHGLLGCVLDGLGRPIGDDRAGTGPSVSYPTMAGPPNPMQRAPIDEPLVTGVRAIDGFNALGVGQRVGVFAAAGVGKSTLLGMLARNASVDICVVALIGERGREVREFIERSIPPEVRERTVVVVATADQPAMQRVRAAHVATAIAEFFRDQGHHVMLLMDSVTRFARALREIGLAAGEPPTRRGFPASVFAELPRLVERAGTASRGAITAIYAVLVEGDDMTEPVADEVRSLVDGHLVLSRELADANHYPAIDVAHSRSRLMDAIADRQHVEVAGDIRRLISRYSDLELLIQMGEYRRGNDAEADRAINCHDKINEVLRQSGTTRCDLADTVSMMQEAIGDGDG